MRYFAEFLLFIPLPIPYNNHEDEAVTNDGAQPSKFRAPARKRPFYRTQELLN